MTADRLASALRRHAEEIVCRPPDGQPADDAAEHRDRLLDRAEQAEVGRGVLCRPAEWLSRYEGHCPTCGGVRRFAVRLAVWYGATQTCLGCGDSWTDGERHERPFQRGWRRKAIAAAERVWEEAGGFDPAGRDAWIREQVAS